MKNKRIYPVERIAKYVIEKTNHDRWVISNLKLQKLLYFIQAEFVVSRVLPCFNEDIIAVSWGTIIDEVYHKYKVYGAGHIPTIDKEVHGEFLNKKDREKIDGIIEQCRDYSSADLSEIVTRQTPWKKAYYDSKDKIITLESLIDFFG